MIDTFDSLLDRFAIDSLRPDPTKTPDTLYHYTDATGLIGMLQSGKIWATEHRFLNDKTELQHTKSLLEGVLSERLRKSPSDSASKLYASIMDMQRASGEDTEIYLFSLSEDPDSLSQWRGYAREGRGFTIGFCGSELAQQCGPDKSIGFAKIEYDHVKQERALRLALEAVETLLEQRIEIDPAATADEISHASHMFNAIVWNRSVINKHSSFRSEKEWRIFEFVQNNAEKFVQVRTRGESIVPYVQCALTCKGKPKLPVTRIGIGPGFAGTEEIVAVRAALRKFEYDPEIYFADTPYRRL